MDRRTRNHINGIEGWSYAKHILYNYRGVSKYRRCTGDQYRFNHRKSFRSLFGPMVTFRLIPNVNIQKIESELGRNLDDYIIGIKTLLNIL